jgi:hypothetical protein
MTRRDVTSITRGCIRPPPVRELACSRAAQGAQYEDVWSDHQGFFPG